MWSGFSDSLWRSDLVACLMAMDNELNQLIAAAGSGDAEAFRQLVERCNPDLAAFVASRAPSWDCCEECVQSTWITVHAKLSTFERDRDFGAWLRGIARLHLLELLRRRRDRPLDAALLARLEQPAEADLATEPVARAADLDECLAALQPRIRTMLERRHVESVPVKRLAQQFKQTEAAIAGLLRRARAQLQRCLSSKVAQR